jgi:DNA-binding Xre family transcriptional regulator
VPYYSSHTSRKRLINSLKGILDTRNISSFKLSRVCELSPTTTRKIYMDSAYIPSPDVLERICLVLNVEPGDILKISSNIESQIAVCSGV